MRKFALIAKTRVDESRNFSDASSWLTRKKERERKREREKDREKERENERKKEREKVLW